MKALILMTQFLTRIPLPIQLDVTEEDFKRGIYFFTAIGALLGALLLLVYYLLNPFFSSLSLAVIIVFLHIINTGALHLDGLADAADGLFSNRSAKRILEIMHDSRIGSNGVVALIFVIGLKIALVYELLLKGGFLYLLVIPVLGRFGLVFSAYLGKSPREKGMGNLFINQVSKKQLVINIIVLAIIMLFLPWSIVATFSIILYVHFMLWHCQKKIGGITGDILGFNCEVSEVLSLFVICMLVTI